MAHFVISISESSDKYFPIIAEKIRVPEGVKIGWDTKIKFGDGVQGFITVDRKPLSLINGKTIMESFNSKIDENRKNERYTVFNRPRNPEITIYAYRQIIAGCSVGTRFPFKDLEDGEKKEVSVFWNVSLSTDDPNQLTKEAANAEGGKINTDYCNKALRERGNLQGIIEQVILKHLLEVPFSAIRSRIDDISREITNVFNSNRDERAVGFEIVSLTLGNIKIAE